MRASRTACTRTNTCSVSSRRYPNTPVDGRCCPLLLYARRAASPCATRRFRRLPHHLQLWGQLRGEGDRSVPAQLAAVHGVLDGLRLLLHDRLQYAQPRAALLSHRAAPTLRTHADREHPHTRAAALLPQRSSSSSTFGATVGRIGSSGAPDGTSSTSSSSWWASSSCWTSSTRATR